MDAVDETSSLRLRRDENDEQVKGGYQKEKTLPADQPDKPFHRQRESLLNSSNVCIKSKTVVNLCIALMVVSTIHILLESILNHGFLIDPVQWYKVLFNKPTESPSFLILLGLNFFILSSFGIEILLSKCFISKRLGLCFITTLLASEVLFPAIIVNLTDCYSVAALIVLCFVVLVFLKLVSYHAVNFWCRESLFYKVHRHSISNNERKDKGDVKNENITSDIVHYPNNLNLKDIYYFIFAPTVCYELNFPRSPRIRKRFLLKCILESLFSLLYVVCVMQQWLAPAVYDLIKLWQESDYARVLERTLKLAVPCFSTWFFLFYLVFHSSLNAVAEILRFGDRYFYGDWWNSDSMKYHWKTWNIPIHNWCFRHLYIPLMENGFTKFQASCVIFLVSGFFHEYLYSAPVKAFRAWTCFSLLAQAFEVTKDKSSHSKDGNFTMWFLLMMGGPFVIIYIFVITV